MRLLIKIPTNKSVAGRIPLYLLVAISGYVRKGHIRNKGDIHSYTMMMTQDQ